MLVQVPRAGSAEPDVVLSNHLDLSSKVSYGYV